MRQLLAVSRSATTPPTIASSLAKPQPGSCEELDIPIAHLHLAHRGGPERWALGRGRTVTVGRPSIVWLCGLE